MPHVNTVTLWLIDGKVEGRIQATLDNWTGVGYRIPPNSLSLKDPRNDLKSSGVYFLVGREEKSGNLKVKCTSGKFKSVVAVNPLPNAFWNTRKAVKRASPNT